MNKRPILVAFSNQKGGVGKSTVTVVLASYFNYVRGLKVAVVDCDYPQFSLEKLRGRDLKNIEKASIISDFSAASLKRAPVRLIQLSLLLQKQPQRFQANWKVTMT